MNHTDQPTAIRNGEALDEPKIESFLRDAIPRLRGKMRLLQFPGGNSNLTYCACFDNRDLVLRRPPFGRKAKTAHDMGREYRILSAIHTIFPYAPRALCYTEDESIIGCPFYVMERIKGIILRTEVPPGIMESPLKVRKMFERFLEVMTELHALDYKAVGLENLGKPQGYVKRQVTGWNQRYRAARTPDAPDCEDIMAWLEEKMPPESQRPAIIHNDFKFDNIILDKDDPLKIVGVLDWEMSTLGDPIMDLGCTLGYWIEKDDPPEARAVATMPTYFDGVPTRRELVDLYANHTGLRMENFDFYYCFGLFRLAGIAQQIYYRYYHGQTNDERFKTMILGVKYYDQTARRVIEHSDI
jgi:aminoglycoside phosphotransferase (APT) family kinase protein